MGSLLIRADANVTIATGHVMRCMALGQAWQDEGGKVTFVLGDCTESLKDKLRSEGFDVVHLQVTPGSPEDAAQTAALGREHAAEWLVVDGYHFGAGYQRAIMNSRRRLLFVDDYGHADYYSASLVLNQNAHASERFYRNRATATGLLLGSRYAMLRREFRSWRQWRREVPALGQKVLATMGGSDPENVTNKVLDAIELLNMGCLEVTVVLGSSNPHTDSLLRRVARSSHNIHMIQDAPNMAHLMASADVAVAGAGATCWEMCFLGLPSVLVDLAPNQTPIARRLDRMGVGVHAGSAASVTPAEIARELEQLLRSVKARNAMSLKGRKLVDGSGAASVARSMKDYTANVTVV